MTFIILASVNGMQMKSDFGIGHCELSFEYVESGFGMHP